MMRHAIGASAAIMLIAAATRAQSRPPDVSGRWQLVEPTSAERALDTLAINAPDQLLITQTPLAIVIEHPSQPGTHPEAGTYRFGTGGYVGSSGGTSLLRETWDASFMGTQLLLSRSMTFLDERGVRSALASGSMWRL